MALKTISMFFSIRPLPVKILVPSLYCDITKYKIIKVATVFCDVANYDTTIKATNCLLCCMNSLVCLV